MLIFDISATYEVLAHLGAQYGALVKALGTGAGSGNPLRPGDFLREIDAALPPTVGPGDRPAPADVVQLPDEFIILCANSGPAAAPAVQRLPVISGRPRHGR